MKMKHLTLVAGIATALSGNAFGQADENLGSVTRTGSEQFQLRMDEAARIIENTPRLRQFTHQQGKDLVEFVAANLLFTLVHEMGHALITEMGLPVLGREEDAADAYAVLAMLRSGSHFTDGVLIQAAKSWFLTDERAQAEGIKAAFYDEHGMDKQRAYQIICLMVGSDPNKYGHLATEVGMPEERQGSCQGDYSNAKWSWDALLKPHLRGPARPKQQIDAVYGPGRGLFDSYAEANRAILLLETVAESESDRYVWRTPFTIEMQTCGIQNAHWDISTHKLTVCYEIAGDFVSLYEDYVLRKDPSRKRPAARAPARGPCPCGQVDVSAANAIRYYSGGEH